MPNMKFIIPQTRKVSTYYFGSLFTQSFTGVIWGLEEDEDAIRDWTNVCRRTQESIDAQFPELCQGGVIPLGSGNRIRQKSQTVTAWINDVPVRTR